MARIFSIQFTYQGMTHSAMVSVRPTPFFTEYSLSMLQEDLQQQLPGNKIISAAPNQFQFLNHPTGTYSELMDSIIKAVAGYLHSSPV